MLDAEDRPQEASETGTPAPEAERYVRPKQTRLVRFGKSIRAPVNAWFAKQSLIPTSPIIDAEHLPALAVNETEWRAIRDEAAALLAGREDIPAFGKISPDHRRIASGPQWKSFFFEGYGFRSEKNRALCPATAAFLDRIPGLVVGFYSIMAGDTHVPRHRGLTKAWLNCHLPLVVPKNPGRCEIDVDGTLHQWREGEWFVFDETFAHEVWNDTGQSRVVLMLQVRRPMRWPGRMAARTIYELIRRTGFVQDVRQALGA
ncbi:aspartyl/asparaginyl beta-hydroxylase domain-containing protein [Parerythrobacter aestuarii]|uniref:aspartyl/asparaginyl beta-hydroxylase domain-containing protein n=1 Tax=Parerythrobacter aestuarii TaxID=3020909 RepID=UPI0024DEEF04|nr:aspartyl/asparaginyl beta-hydroxylase domain-containing protein [Parerythrobacter aestuarii]